jgi:hypothetical protein
LKRAIALNLQYLKMHVAVFDCFSERILNAFARLALGSVRYKEHTFYGLAIHALENNVFDGVKNHLHVLNVQSCPRKNGVNLFKPFFGLSFPTALAFSRKPSSFSKRQAMF